jgi:Superinfection immunity protein
MDRKTLYWVLGVTLGAFVFFVLFIKSDLFAGTVGAGLVVLLILFGVGIYFVPAIKAYQDRKTNKGAILALNIFLGWTLIGWVVALVWAFSKDTHVNPSVVLAIPPTLCTSCGRYSHGDAVFCMQCGRKLSDGGRSETAASRIIAR